MSQSPAEKFFWRKDPTADLKQEAVVSRDAKGAPEESAPKKTEARSTTVLIGIPCHNAEATIAKTVVHLLPLGADIVICDDGSSDATEEIGRKMGCRVIKHPRELGRSDAITSLYLAAKKLKAEVLLTVPVGSNISLTDASRLVEAVQKDEIDIAIGSSFDREAVDHARHEGRLTDRASLFRAYGKKALAMISPAGTGSVVVEKEVLEFADQQGLRVREFPTVTFSESAVQQESLVQFVHFETKFMDYVATKHPLVFLGIPSLGFLYGAVLETVLNANFSGPIPLTLARFTIALTSSPLFLVSVALSIGSAILYSQKKILSKIRDTNQEVTKL